MLCSNCGSQFSDFMPVCPSCGKDFRVSKTGVIFQNDQGGAAGGQAPSPVAKLIPQTPTPEAGKPLPKPFAPIEIPEEKPKQYAKVEAKPEVPEPLPKTPPAPVAALPKVEPPPVAPKPTIPTVQPVPATLPSVPEKANLPALVKPILSKPQPFVPKKINWLVTGSIFAVILVFFLLAGIWVLDEMVPGFLPFRLYDLVAGKQQISNFLPQNTAGFLTIKIGGSSNQIKNAGDLLKKIPGGGKVQENLSQFLHSSDLENYFGISFKNDLQPALGDEIYLTNFSFKTGENDLALAVSIKDEAKFSSAFGAIQKKQQTKVTAQEKFGVKYYIVDLSQAGRTGQIISKTYQFRLGNFWFITTTERSAINIFQVRDTQKLSKIFFGGLDNLSFNSLYKKFTDYYGSQDNLVSLYLSGDKLKDAEQAQFTGLDRMLDLATKNSALGAALSAEQKGFRFSYRYFTNNIAKLVSTDFETSDSLAKYVPQKLLGAPIAIYYQGGLVSAEIANLEKAFKSSEQFWNRMDDLLGIKVKDELIPLFTGGWAAFASVPENTTNPEIGSIIQLSDPAKMGDLLEKIRSNSKTKWRKTKSDGTAIYYAKPEELQGLSAAAAVVGDRLLLCSSLKCVKELITFEAQNVAPLSEDATFQAVFKQIEGKVHAATFVFPEGVYALIKLYLGNYFSSDADLVLADLAKTLKSASFVNFSDSSRVGGELFMSVEALDPQELQKADDAFGRILQEVTPTLGQTTPAETLTPAAETATETPTLSESPTETPTETPSQ